MYTTKKLDAYKVLNRISNLLDLKNNVCFSQHLSRFGCVAPKGCHQAVWYMSYTPSTWGILQPLFSFLIDDVWLPGLCCPAHRGEHTNHRCSQGSSPHFGVSKVQELLEGGWELLRTVRVLPIINLLVCMWVQLRDQQKRSFMMVFGLRWDVFANKQTWESNGRGWERNVVLLLFIPAIYNNVRVVLVPFSPGTVCSAGSGWHFGGLFLLIFCYSVYGGYHQ